ncbi:MAG: radical SAM protein [Acidobacteria bacterium]|nr:radical SAM protein [Acidobacteriota bacterium]
MPTSAPQHVDEISLAINEIFVSIQGESTWAGLPCVFLRTTGCPLRCRWCDTEYAFYEGNRWHLDDLVDEACRHRVDLVEITGGEPLAQPGTPALAEALLRRGKTVLVETSGSFDISVLPDGAHAIMDLKCPSSGELEHNDLGNLDRLRPGDEVKFVIGNREDYDWAAEMVREHDLTGRCPVLFSPVWNEVEFERLAQWILADGLAVRMQLQLHKILWPDVERGV